MSDNNKLKEKEKHIKSGLKTKHIGHNVIYFDTLKSTNEYGKTLLKNDNSFGTCIIADNQIAGRGRLKRQWFSGDGQNICMSILLEPNIFMNQVGLVTLSFAIVVGEAIYKLCGVRTKYKWPNDIMYDGKKISGILFEGVVDTKLVGAVVGIGINIKKGFPNDIKDIGISLEDILPSGTKIDRYKLIQLILEQAEEMVSLIDKGETKHIIDKWKDNNCIIGKEIVAGNLVGKVIDIEEDGGLLLEEKDGNIEKIISGEISIRGLNSYI